MFHILRKKFTKVAFFFSKIYYHTSVSVAFTTEVCAPAMLLLFLFLLLLIILGNKKLRAFGVLQWQNDRTKFSENRPIGLILKRARAHTQHSDLLSQLFSFKKVK